jgi:hypothetical protein
LEAGKWACDQFLQENGGYNSAAQRRRHLISRAAAAEFNQPRSGGGI